MKGLFILAILTLLVLPIWAQVASPTPPPADSNQTIAALGKSIDDCQAKQDYACLVQISSKGIELYPADPRFYLYRGIGLQNLKKHDEAIADYTKVIAIAPKVPDAFNYRGIAYVNINDYDKAVADFRKALELDPSNADAKKNLGLAKAKQTPKIPLTADNLIKFIDDCKAKENYPCMVELATEDIESYPADARFYFKRGEGLADLNKFNESLADLAKALEINPKYNDVLFLRAIVYELAGKNDNAVDDYRKAVENAPTIENYLVMGKAINRITIEKMKCGAGTSTSAAPDCVAKLNEAIAVLTRGVNQAAESAVFMFLGERAISYRAISKLGIDKTKEAKADEEKALANLAKTTTAVNKKLDEVNKKIEEENKIKSDILNFLKQGNVCLENKDYVCVIQIANDGLKQHAGASDLLNLRASGFLLQGKIEEAGADYTRIIEADPKFADAFYGRGHVYESLYEYDKAVADFTQAINLRPNFTGALLERGAITVYRGQYESAEADLKKVVELDPQNKTVAYFVNLIMTLKDAGFNIGKSKEDTLLRYFEYKTRIEKAINIANGYSNLLASAAAEIPQSKEKVCGVINNLNPSVEITETYQTKLAQMISDQKLDKAINFKIDAQVVVTKAIDFKKSYDGAKTRFGCK